MDKGKQTEIRAILTGNAPPPAGHYVQATVWNGLVHISGQLPVRPDGSHAADAPFEEQARQAIANLLAVLKASGSAPDRLLKVTAYIVGVENWPRFNGVYASMLGDAKPARAVVPVTELHYGYLVEIDAVAALEEN